LDGLLSIIELVFAVTLGGDAASCLDFLPVLSRLSSDDRFLRSLAAAPLPLLLLLACNNHMLQLKFT
jgi:hypothetical protein